jgi:hypothetical protein
MKKTWVNVAVVAAIGAVIGLGATVFAQHTISELPPYPLPDEVRESMAVLAGECDIMILGETHGTREVPAIVETLLEPLTKLGYRVIALEVPHDEQPAIEAWATGTTGAIPTFFAVPWPDGRGNREVLAMVRRALQPPYEWKLICFDATEMEMQRQMMERLPKDVKGTIAERAAKLSSDDFVAISLQRDASMAINLAAGRRKMAPADKVLVICGNLHARTANHIPPELEALWPSFAAKFMQDEPKSRVGSVNVEAFGGEYFNGGKVNQFTPRPLERVRFQRTPDLEWDAELSLPTATVATFLRPPDSGQ